jgi:transglutaminase superfamily protein
MRHLTRFIRLSKPDRWLVVQALAATVIVRLSLSWFTLRTIEHLAVRFGWRNNQSISAHRIVWAVRSAARFVPRSTCLIRAMVARALLIRHGYRPLLMIGVSKNECERFSAHAWVTCEGEVLIGSDEVANYTTLLEVGF